MMDPLHLKRAAQRAVTPLVCLAVVAYLAHHTFIGERGIYTHLRLEKQARELSAELVRLEIEREKLERRIALINNDNPDPDMLDERARAVLNFAHPDEITILKHRKR